MKVTYIKHSGFYVEMEQHSLLFDYYQGEIPKCKEKENTILVFVSHKHHDHFNMEIFQLAREYPNIQFFISRDAKMNLNYMRRMNIPEEAINKISFIGRNEKFDFKHVQIETLTSTDQGVAFVVTCENKVIYHAGDLNWWSWCGETEEQYKDMKLRYIKEIDKLKNRKLDIAFVPLDPRQEEFYWYGMDYFLRTVNSKYVFPMHCWEDYSIIEKFLQREETQPFIKNIVSISEKGQHFILKNK